MTAQRRAGESRAAANIAHLTVKRYLPLVGTQYVSKQEYDRAVATAQQADASVVAAKAGVESARINLAYTKVTSPVDGRIGKSSVTEGALVTNGGQTPRQRYSNWIRCMSMSPSPAMILCV